MTRRRRTPNDEMTLPARQPRRGLVHAVGRNFADDGGPFLSLGTSLFWAPWGVLHDTARLDQHLAFIADHGFDDIRALFVLPNADLWAQRRIDPFTDELERSAVALADLAASHGLRVAPTILGDPIATSGQHGAFVDRFVTALTGRESLITHLTVANEPGNKWSGDAGRAELWSHAALCRARSPWLVSLGSAEDYPYPGPDWLYADSPATMADAHPDRDINGDGGRFRPSRQPYGYSAFRLPKIVEAGEPRGPNSSGSWTSDPVELAADMIMVYMSGWARYVLHTGEGIYGLAQPNRTPPRAANLWEATNIEAIMSALVGVRAALPVDLPNFTNLTHANPSRNGQFVFETVVGGDWDLTYTESGTRAYSSQSVDGRFFAITLKQERAIRCPAPRAMTFDVLDLNNRGAVLDTVTLGAGQAYQLPAVNAAMAIKGRYR